MFKKIILSILIIVGSMVSFSNCLQLTDKKQAEYHEGFEDLERCVLDELGDYIRFDVPQISTSNYPINGTKILSLRVVFLSQFLKTQSDDGKVRPIEVAERTRELLNTFLSNHSDFYDKTTKINVLFVIPPSGPYERVVLTTNYDYETKTYGSRLTTVVPYEDDISCFYGKSDIEIMDVCDYDCSFDQIIEVADNMPQLKYILVKDQETADKASNLRPNVKFYYVSEEYYKSQD